jgi:fructose-1,6-bisphosphatase/inositol monophosphatase family enzyme
MAEHILQPHTDQFLGFGDSVVVAMRERILALWDRTQLRSDLKSDSTPVSEVDLQCEEIARAAIRKAFPEHGIIGEEYGSEAPDAEFVWTIDPIDGTLNLINRIPTFGTILALLYRGRPILGWIDHPLLRQTLRGGASTGVFSNGTPVTLQDLPTPHFTPTDVIATNCPATFARGGQEDILAKVLSLHPHVRIYYDVYSHTLAVLGALALMVEYNLKIWDIAATRALMEGVGGSYHDLGSQTYSDEPTVYHAAFGKPRAVQRAAEVLSSALLPTAR